VERDEQMSPNTPVGVPSVGTWTSWIEAAIRRRAEAEAGRQAKEEDAMRRAKAEVMHERFYARLKRVAQRLGMSRCRVRLVVQRSFMIDVILVNVVLNLTGNHFGLHALPEHTLTTVQNLMFARNTRKTTRIRTRTISGSFW
jgi:hypothetical protein